MKRLFLASALFACLASASGPKVFTGVVTDTMCGQDHAHMKVTPEARCVRECVKSGQFKYALLTNDSKVFVLSDQATPEKFAARKVRVTGTLYEKTGILKVDKIEAAD